MSDRGAGQTKHPTYLHICATTSYAMLLAQTEAAQSTVSHIVPDFVRRNRKAPSTKEEQREEASCCLRCHLVRNLQTHEVEVYLTSLYGAGQACLRGPWKFAGIRIETLGNPSTHLSWASIKMLIWGSKAEVIVLPGWEWLASVALRMSWNLNACGEMSAC